MRAGSVTGDDAVSRVGSIAQQFPNGNGNATTTFGYSPASQIVTQARDNDAYAWTGSVSVSRGYAVNGLNQYTSAGSATFACREMSVVVDIDLIGRRLQ